MLFRHLNVSRQISYPQGIYYKLDMHSSCKEREEIACSCYVHLYYKKIEICLGLYLPTIFKNSFFFFLKDFVNLK